MPKRCVAFNCNNTNGEGISLHAFPEDTHIASLWIRFVRTKRAKWTKSDFSFLCSKHFTEDCFSNFLKVKMRHSKKLLLEPNAVPTIHAKDPKTEESSTTQPLVRPAVRKRQINEVRLFICNWFKIVCNLTHVDACDQTNPHS